MAAPRSAQGRLNAGICVFGIPYACGFVGAGTPYANPQPLAGKDIVELAVKSGLSFAEMPPSMFSESQPEHLREICDIGQDKDVSFIVSGGHLRASTLRDDLRLALAVGATTVRCILSSVLCGDRRPVEGGWPNYLKRLEVELEEILPEFEKHGVALAMENHQDATSAELVALCARFESPSLGITLDTGNPLAVMEEPLDFARAVAPYLRHVHMKDYLIHPAPNGYRLVRCPMGQGVIDFPALLRLMDELPQTVTRSVEIAAVNARLIPILERSWWETFPPRDVRDILPAMDLVWRELRPATDAWETPVERGATGGEIATWEWDDYWMSVAYLRGISEVQ